MERRLLTFVIASTAFFICYAWLRVTFAPPIPQNLAGDADPAAELVIDQPDEPAAVVLDETDDQSDVTALDEPVEPRPDRPQRLTAGSMNPASGHYMLVYYTSRGGAIERIELTERDEDGGLKYRRVDVFNGYLGYLAGETSLNTDGVVVNVVGPGTPADLAGIRVGDVIVGLNGQPVASRRQLEQELSTTKPGEQVSVDVLRAGLATPISLPATLTEHPLDVVRLARDGGTDQVDGNLTRASCLLTLGHVNRKGILTNEQAIAELADPTELNWFATQQSNDGANTVEFSVELSEAEMKPIGGKPVRLARTYSVVPGSYAVQMSVQIENLAEEPQRLAYRLEGANGITLEGWWYSTKISPNFSGAAARDIVYKTAANGHVLISGYDLLKRAKKETQDPKQTIFAPNEDQAARTLNYIGVDAQYFFVGYVPSEGNGPFTSLQRASAGVVADPEEIPRHQERAVNSTFYLDSRIADVPAGESLRQELQLFAGPKRTELLNLYALGDCIYYGWFAYFAKLLGKLLHILSAVGNYALAIILLTVIVRAIMFPLSRKAAVNAQKMQELAPELKKIKEKHKDDMEAQLKAQRELQQRVGFNPLAGCLPMFLQLPIFIGLYRTLSVDIELRQAAFSSHTDWASNLAAPDMFTYWGGWMWEYLAGRGTGWLGPYFNILPVFVVVLFLAQQKMFMPPATDEQTAMTQKMMNIMTLMMGLFFFRVPAGLCIYFITSSLWGICERIMVKKTLPTSKHFDSALLEGDGPSGGDDKKSQSIADRIRSQVAKPEQTFERPNKRKRPKKKK